MSVLLDRLISAAKRAEKQTTIPIKIEITSTGVKVSGETGFGAFGCSEIVPFEYVVMGAVCPLNAAIGTVQQKLTEKAA